MNKTIRSVILNCALTRELFFIIKGKKVNLKKVNNRIKNYIENKNKQSLDDVVVSLTSYGDRINELKYTLFSLIDQTVKPLKIVVNLADKDMDLITDELKKFEEFGVSYVKTEDLKSYKKLIPTVKAYPDKCIVTADDDLYYPKDWLEKLWYGHLNNPNSIICHLTKKIGFRDESLLPYVQWSYNQYSSAPSLQNFILSGAGTLFPPNSLYEDLINKDLFTKLTPAADDVWDYFMAYLKNTKIEQIPNSYVNVRYVNPYREYGIDKGETLTQINVDMGKNDEQFNSVMSYYGISEKDFVSSIQQD